MIALTVAGSVLARCVIVYAIQGRWCSNQLSQACPILFLHGTDDRIIPHAHSERLAELAKKGRIVLLRGGHNDSPRDQHAFLGRRPRLCHSLGGV